MGRGQNLPNGARFIKCALQVNPASYARTFRGEDQVRDKDQGIDTEGAACETVDGENGVIRYRWRCAAPGLPRSAM